jgi:hypothetical protein
LASKIIPFSTLSRQQHLHYLKRQAREYREREDYLLRLRRLLFQIEAQMRQTEMQQLEGFLEIAAHFKFPLALPDLGDRLGLQQFFSSHPFLVPLQDFFAARLTADECLQQIMALIEKPDSSHD